jgi:hypothetical protein
LTTTLAKQPWIPLDAGPAKIAYVAAGIATSVYLVAIVASFVLPDPGIEIHDE